MPRNFEGGQEGQEGEATQEGRRRQVQEEAHRVILHLHLQGAQAGAPRHWYLNKGMSIMNSWVHLGHL